MENPGSCSSYGLSRSFICNFIFKSSIWFWKWGVLRPGGCLSFVKCQHELSCWWTSVFAKCHRHPYERQNPKFVSTIFCYNQRLTAVLGLWQIDAFNCTNYVRQSNTACIDGTISQPLTPRGFNAKWRLRTPTTSLLQEVALIHSPAWQVKHDTSGWLSHEERACAKCLWMCADHRLC